MRYFIDGYNLLFHLSPSKDSLQQWREWLISDLNKKISPLHLNISIVFDGVANDLSSSIPSFHGQLEVIFTHEETADEYLLGVIQRSSQPKQIVVVTSDKKLASQIRQCSGKTQTIQQFLAFLNKAYQKKLQHREGINQSKLSRPTIKNLVKDPKHSPLLESSKQANLHDLTDYYKEIFEKKFDEISKKEAQLKDRYSLVKKRPKAKKIDPFEEKSATAEEPYASEQERWLKLFEKNRDSSM